MNRWLALIPLALLVGLVVFAALKLGDVASRSLSQGQTQGNEYRPSALVGQPIPQTVLPILTGTEPGPGQVDLKTAGVGKPMLVNVFASWCAPCRVEHPKLMALRERGVAVGMGRAGACMAWTSRSISASLTKGPENLATTLPMASTAKVSGAPVMPRSNPARPSRSTRTME